MHYKDGTPANIGDVLKTPEGRIGTVVHIMPGCESCNAQVAAVKVSTPEKVYYHAAVTAINNPGDLKFAWVEVLTVTLGECEKVV